MAIDTSTLPSHQDFAEVFKDGITPAALEKIQELRRLFVAVQEENVKLRERVRQLEAANVPKYQLIFDKGVYWTVEGTQRDGPFCPACQDRNSKLVHLHYTQTGTPGVYWLCKSCQQSF